MRADFVILCRLIRLADLSHQVSDGQRAGRYPDRQYHRHAIQSAAGLNPFQLVVIKVKLSISKLSLGLLPGNKVQNDEIF